MCASSRRQSYFKHPRAAAHLQKSQFVRGWGVGGGGGLSDGMKNTNGALEDLF